MIYSIQVFDYQNDGKRTTRAGSIETHDLDIARSVESALIGVGLKVTVCATAYTEKGRMFIPLDVVEEVWRAMERVD